MSVTGGLKTTPAGHAASRPQWMRANAEQWFAMLGRAPRGKAAATPAWRAPFRLMVGAVAAIAAILMTMAYVDAWAISAVQRLPEWLTGAFDEVTDFGNSGWFLVPIGLLLAVIAALASPLLPRMSRLVLAAVSVRLAFLFLAIAAPGLVFTIVKRLIGRARPLVEGGLDPFLYRPLGWNVEYASLPSGHAVNACAAAFAIGGLWPRARAVMWAYALVIAVSRVVLTAHHPSDVVAGAIAGVVGALLVRDWFAARRLGFVLGADGARAAAAWPVVPAHQKCCPAGHRPIRSSRHCEDADGIAAGHARRKP